MKECLALYKDTSDQAAYKFGQELYGRLSVSMIYNCSAYYHLIDTVRNSLLEGLDKDSIKRAILSMNKSNRDSQDKDFFTQRGVLYFQISDLDDALSDFDSAIKLDQQALQSIYFKAWVLELKRNYDESFSLYSNLAILTKNNEFNIFAAIVKRKKSDR